MVNQTGTNILGEQNHENVPVLIKNNVDGQRLFRLRFFLSKGTILAPTESPDEDLLSGAKINHGY